MTNPNKNIKGRPYRVVEYNAEWPKLYNKYRVIIENIFDDNVVEIHHFGSTSIPGMFAKPNIDIYMLVKSLDDVRSKYEEMKKEGFTPKGDYSNIGEEYFTLDTEQGERIASVHVFDGSGEMLEGYKNFRDYLISNPNERNRYISLKKKLYRKFKDDYPSYDAGKKELIEELKAKANQWAKEKNKNE